MSFTHTYDVASMSPLRYVHSKYANRKNAPANATHAAASAQRNRRSSLPSGKRSANGISGTAHAPLLKPYIASHAHSATFAGTQSSPSERSPDCADVIA
jgi:hypothetical protein